MATRLELYEADVTLNGGHPTEKMIIIENEDSYLCIDKNLFSISFDKPLDNGVIIKKLDNICFLNFKT